MAPGRTAHRSATAVLSTLMLVLGLAIIARTLAAGGGALSIGLILGVLFTLAGAGRLYVARKG
jgi:hypothetical protein